MNKSNARELLLHGLRDMYDAEHRFADALGTMAQQATNRSLADGFRRHREVTRKQIGRLEECFEVMNERPSRETCAGAEGLVEEYQSFVRKERPDSETLDVFAAGSALKVEHYEIAAYATMIDLAFRLDMTSCATQLEKNMREEEGTAAELEMSFRRLGAELTGSTAGLRGAIEGLRAGSRSGGAVAVGRAVASQATGAIGRLEQRGRKARAASTRKRSTGARKSTTTRGKAKAKVTRKAKTTGRKTTTARRGTTARATTRRPASRSRATTRRTSTGPKSKRTTARRGATARRRTTRARSSR